MKIIIIRHADPNYEIDSLTPQGFREAELLSERMAKLKVKQYYCSPYGRAQDTIAPTLNRVNASAETLNWLKEFPPTINRPDNKEERKVAWDWLPQDWMKEPMYYAKDLWHQTPVMQEGKVQEEYEKVCRCFDELLSKHGYTREGNYYKVVCANEDTIVLVCHFGLECVLLSHLLNVSPMPLWHGLCAAPSSVSTIITEERREGIASFRMSSFGDISHLYCASEEPSFAARFCECYKHFDMRHD